MNINLMMTKNIKINIKMKKIVSCMAYIVIISAIIFIGCGFVWSVDGGLSPLKVIQVMSCVFLFSAFVIWLMADIIRECNK